MLGEEEVEKVSTHRQRLELDLGSRTYSKDFKRLAAPDRIREAERDTALLVYGNLPPAWLDCGPGIATALRAHVTAPPPPAAPIAPEVADDVASPEAADDAAA